MTLRVQCQKGTDELNHGTERFTVSPISWQVDLPDDVARFMIADGKSGIVLIGPVPPDANHPAVASCPDCGYTWEHPRLAALAGKE